MCASSQLRFLRIVCVYTMLYLFFFQAEDGIRDSSVTGVQTCALPICLPWKAEGDPLPPSKGDVEDRLEKIPNVVRAQLEAVCCEEGKAILFVGVEEKEIGRASCRERV